MLKLYAFWNVPYNHPKYTIMVKTNIIIAAECRSSALYLLEKKLGDHIRRDEYKPNCQMIGTAGKSVKEGFISPLDF